MRRLRLKPPKPFPRGLAIPIFLAIIGLLGLVERGFVLGFSSSVELSELVSSVSEVELSSELLVYSLLSSESLVSASLSPSTALGVSGEGSFCWVVEVELVEITCDIALRSCSI